MELQNLGLQRAALGSWADEMETQPLPAAPAPYRSSRGEDRGPSRRDELVSGPAWGRQPSGMGGSSMGGGMGSGMGDRGASYGT